MEEIEAGEVTVKDEEDEEDEGAILNAIEDALRETEEEESAAVNKRIKMESVPAAQQTFSTGMASPLNILRQQASWQPPLRIRPIA